jgi:hypothetical protein
MRDERVPCDMRRVRAARTAWPRSGPRGIGVARIALAEDSP